jgi:hypothetical protein
VHDGIGKNGASTVDRGAAGLRRAYFGAGVASARYGVGFDRLVRHLDDLGAASRPSSRVPRCVEDLLHAIACVDGSALAWMDLTERYERLLVRRSATQIGPTAAIVAVRRLFSELRRETGRGGTPGLSLRSYRGDLPLRQWLADALVARLTRERTMSRAAAPTGHLRLVEAAPPLAPALLTAADGDPGRTRDVGGPEPVGRHGRP